MNMIFNFIAAGFQDYAGSTYMWMILFGALGFVPLWICHMVMAKKIDLTPWIKAAIAFTVILGLLGTVTGVMMSFDAIANAPAAQRSTELAKGISVALATTLFALMTASNQVVAAGISTTVVRSIRK